MLYCLPRDAMKYYIPVIFFLYKTSDNNLIFVSNTYKIDIILSVYNFVQIVEKITYLFIIWMQYRRHANYSGMLHYLGYPRPCWVRSIPRYARDASGPNKVSGNLDNAKFPIICMASLLPPYNEEINNHCSPVPGKL